MIIKLADCDLISIDTETGLKGEFDYYYTEPIDNRYWNERFILKFIFDCTGSSLLHWAFLQLW